jgi:DMSO/TMAO reductase YedYZ molybdopterin-dependent catalytic subunit
MMQPSDSIQSRGSDLNRRGFLRAALAGVLPLLCGAVERSSAAESGHESRGLILREKEPENLEFPFASLDRFLTPNDQFYVRCHFPIPTVDLRTWRLKVEGAVDKPLELTFEDLKNLPSRTQTTLLECAGNARGFLVPKAKGVGWGLGAVSNAEWTGVPLAAILERAGVQKGAAEIVFEGADAGEVKDEPKSPGTIHFARSLPLEKAKQPEILLAYRMNGEELSAAHGFPLRLLVPGWYGMASIKWLTRVIVADKPFQGYFQTLDYAIFERSRGLPTLTPITELAVKAAIARPAPYEVVAAKGAYRVHGAAWCGESEVTKVEVSADGGKSWDEAKLLDQAVPHAWRLWEYAWHTPETAGKTTLRARATDKKGRTQPTDRDPDRRNYMISHVLPIEVTVR